MIRSMVMDEKGLSHSLGVVLTARGAGTKMKERDIGGNRLKEPSEA